MKETSVATLEAADARGQHAETLEHTHIQKDDSVHLLVDY